MPRVSDTSGPQKYFDKLPKDNTDLPSVDSFKLPDSLPKATNSLSTESGINTIFSIGGVETLPANKAMELFILTIGEVIRRQRENQQ